MIMHEEGFMNPESVAASFGISPGMKIADFGSGTGYFAVLMAKITGPNGLVTALDVLNSALESVRAGALTRGLKNVETKHVNLEVQNGSGLADNSQDLVLIKNILFQSEKKGEIIKEAQRVVKNGGEVIIIDWKKGVGGLGPPDNLRFGSSIVQEQASKAGLKFISNLDPDGFHFGIRFEK